MGCLHHIAIGAADVETLAAFYREIFGLEERARHHYPGGELRSIWLDMGGPILMIEHASSLEGARADERATRARWQPSHGVGEGLFLLTFSAADVAARRAVEQRAERAGRPIESRTEYSSYFRDLEGNRVAVSQYGM